MKTLAFLTALVLGLILGANQSYAQNLKGARTNGGQATVNTKKHVKSLPPKVMETLKTQYSEAKVLKYEKINIKNQPAYRVVVDNKGVLSTMDIFETGKVAKVTKGDLLAKPEKMHHSE